MGGPKGRRLNIRVSESEHATITRRARLSGYTVSEYIRRSALQDTDRPIIQTDVEALHAIYRDLRHAGGNTNQIARWLNSHSHNAGDFEEELRLTLRSLRQASDDVSAFIVEVKSTI